MVVVFRWGFLPSAVVESRLVQDVYAHLRCGLTEYCGGSTFQISQSCIKNRGGLPTSGIRQEMDMRQVHPVPLAAMEFEVIPSWTTKIEISIKPSSHFHSCNLSIVAGH